MLINGIIKWLGLRGRAVDENTLFSDEILRAFGLHDAPDEAKAEFLQSASEAILTEVVKKIEAQLPEDRRNEFLQLFERPANDEELAMFFKTHVPNFKELLVEELTRFKREAIAHAKSTDGETAGEESRQE